MDGLNSNETVNKFCDDLLTQNSSSIHLRNFLVDCLVEKIEKKENIKENAQHAHQVFNRFYLIEFYLREYCF